MLYKQVEVRLLKIMDIDFLKEGNNANRSAVENQNGGLEQSTLKFIKNTVELVVNVNLM